MTVNTFLALKKKSRGWGRWRHSGVEANGTGVLFFTKTLLLKSIDALVQPLDGTFSALKTIIYHLPR